MDKNSVGKPKYGIVLGILAAVCILGAIIKWNFYIEASDSTGQWRISSFCEPMDTKHTWSGYICYAGDMPPEVLQIQRTIHGKTDTLLCTKETPSVILRLYEALAMHPQPDAVYCYLTLAAEKPQTQSLVLTFEKEQGTHEDIHITTEKS